jgi:hypothetical protein
MADSRTISRILKEVAMRTSFVAMLKGHFACCQGMTVVYNKEALALTTNYNI